jgi:hypothetical protein
MCAQVSSRDLTQFVVRIDSVDGQILGTGFFAAPGWVVTCAHVVKDEQDVTVVPADPLVEVGGAAWHVAARSASLERGRALWPYPDLAILRTERDVMHPSALLEPDDPIGDQDCHAWGYSRREEGVMPVGSPASFTFEGVEGDGFLKLKAGQAAPGLSGAPLVCPSRRAVVGVITATRDSASALGGWASPISSLLLGGMGVPEKLVTYGKIIKSENRRAAISNRRRWNSVIPIDASGTLDRPWADFIKGPRSTPSSLLSADFGIVPYLFRNEQLDQAVTWCETDGMATPIAIAWVAARGGAGKTRFAIELCRRLQELGWVTGLWREDKSIIRIPLPRLIVIDYAEEVTPAALIATLVELRDHATEMAPVRVLLLIRTRVRLTQDLLDTLQGSAPATLQNILGNSQDNQVAAVPLSLSQRTELYGIAVRSFGQAWHGDTESFSNSLVAFDTPDLTEDRYGLALEVLFEAFDCVLSKESADRSTLPPVERALVHEERYWLATSPRPLQDLNLLRGCAGLAVLAGARDDLEANDLLRILPQLASEASAPLRQALISWLASLYQGPEKLNALRPDRLGEALVSRMLHDREDLGFALLNSVLSLASDSQVERSLDVLTRLTAHDDVVARVTAKLLSRRLEELTLRGQVQAQGQPPLPQRPGIAGVLLRLLTKRMLDLIDKDQAERPEVGQAGLK